MRISTFNEIVVISRLNWESLKRRWHRAIAALIGTVGVVAVFVSVLSIATGYRDVVKLSEGSDNVMVFMHGATSEVLSTLSAEQANLVRQSRLAATGTDGEPAVSAEILTILRIAGPQGGTKVVSVRGVDAGAFALHTVRISAGRNVVPGRRELIVGRKLLRQLDGLKLGAVLRLNGADWTVVGAFASENGLIESELWADAGTLQSAREQRNTVSVIYLRLASGVPLKAFEKSLADDPRTNVTVTTEKAYIESQSDSLGEFVETIGYVATSLMALGAAFASLNATHASVSGRSREFATLKALGFQDAAVLTAILLESIVLASVAGLATTLVCYAIFDGYTVSSILGSHNYGAVVFSFKITATLMAQAVALAACIGGCGALYPALKVLKLPTARVLSRQH